MEAVRRGALGRDRHLALALPTGSACVERGLSNECARQDSNLRPMD